MVHTNKISNDMFKENLDNENQSTPRTSPNESEYSDTDLEDDFLSIKVNKASTKIYFVCTYEFCARQPVKND